MQNVLQRERKIFQRACELATSAERNAFLDKACGSDVTLRRQVERLLALQEQADSFFQPETFQEGFPSSLATVGPGVEASPCRGPGTILGRYRLLKKIGEGGFGEVYEAEQWEPIRRRVALKVIKMGMDTREVIHRFEAERQALAIMDHPHIARVFDAGATETGRPYFVMELVQGMSLTAYCEERQLSLRDRLQLFIPVCYAIQHAHQKGLIHRDLKPSNVLVALTDGQAVPKVIDFGIAKAIHQPLTEEPFLTRLGQLAGTPVYMSPEQADPGSQDIDTRSDIYSLGVVLYELLAGQPPLDVQRLRKAGYAEALRMLQQEELPPPSTRLKALGAELAGIARRRQVSPERLKTLLQGDLDWIVLKALEKDRARRYPTANALAQDLESHLRNEPVRAGPPTFSYRCVKFMRRHRPAVLAAAGMLLALLAGFLLFIGEFVQTQRQRDRAWTAEDQARRLAYVSDMSLAQQALEKSNLGLAHRLLGQHQPRAGQTDLRNWEWRYLWQQCRGDTLTVLCQYSNPVCSIACSPDGNSLALGGYDGGLQIWDLAAQKLRAAWPRQGKPCFAGFSSHFLAATDEQGALCLWQGTNSIPLPPEVRRYSEIRGVAFSASGHTMAACTLQGQVLLGDLNTRQFSVFSTESRQPRMHGGDIVLSAQGEWFVTGGRETRPGTSDGSSRGLIRVASSDTGRERIAWPAHYGTITALALTPDDRWLASGAGFVDNTVRLWDVQKGESLACFADHSAWITALAFSPDRRYLASASADQTIRLWDLDQKKSDALLRGHLNEVWAIAFTPDGRNLVSADKEGTVLLWSVPPKAGSLQPSPLPGSCCVADFTSDGKEILGLDISARLNRWNLMDPQAPARFPALASPFNALALRGNLLAACTHSNALHIYNGPSQDLVTNLPLAAELMAVTDLKFACDGRWLVAAGDNHTDSRTISVWNCDTWAPVARWRIPGREAIPVMDVSPEGNLIAFGGGKVQVWNLLTGQRVIALQAHPQSTDAVAFSPDGHFLATASQDGIIKLWETGLWRETARLRGHLLGIHSLAFSPDGSRLATGSLDKEAVKLWDLETQREVLNLPLPNALVTGLRFSSDGMHLLALTSGKTAWLWSSPVAD